MKRLLEITIIACSIILITVACSSKEIIPIPEKEKTRYEKVKEKACQINPFCKN